MPIRPIVLAAGVVILAASPALAQSQAAVAVGLSVTTYHPRGNDVPGSTKIGPVLRLRTGTGLGATIGFDWFNTGVDEEIGRLRQRVGTLRVRPVMAGLGYTIEGGPYALSFSVTGGYAFTSLKVDARALAAYRASTGTDSATIGVSNTPAWRAKATLWYDVAPRVGLFASVAYLGVYPSLELASGQGTDKRRLRADSVVLSLGMAYGIF